MSDNFYATATKLTPPLVVDGVEYGLGLLCNANPDAIDHGQIAAGKLVERFAAPGGFDLKIDRGKNFATFPTDEGTEVTYPVVMGGNFCPTAEPERVYSLVSRDAERGGDSHRRAMPGDALLWDGRRYLISEVESFHYPPDAIRWQDGINLEFTIRANIEVNAIVPRQPSDGRFAFTDDPPPVMNGMGLYAYDEAGVPRLAQRKSFIPGDGDDGLTHYPPCASFAAGTPEYWFDPVAMEFRLGSGCGSPSSGWGRSIEPGSKVGVWYGSTDIAQSQLSGTDACALQNGCRISQWTYGDFAVGSFVGSANSFGSGTFEWHAGFGADPVGIRVTWEGALVGAVEVRETAGGAWTTLATPTFAMTGDWRWFGLTRAGSTFALQTQAAGESSPSAVALWDASAILPDNSAGAVSIGDGGNDVLVTPQAGAWFRSVSDGDPSPTWTRMIYQEFSGVEYSTTVVLPTSNAVVAVENLSANTQMVESSSPSRCNYKVINPTTLQFYSETSGDRILVRQAPDPLVEEVGRPPRCPGTANFATFAEDGINGTTTVAENRGHYFDRVRILDPLGTFAAVEGDDVVCRRDPVFRTIADLQYDQPDTAGTWTSVPAADWLASPADGVVLIRKSWVDAQPAGELCFRVLGDKFRRAGDMQARQLQEPQAALDRLADCYHEVTLGGPTTARSVKTLGVYGIVPATYKCNDACGVVPAAYTVGVAKNTWRGFFDDFRDVGITEPIGQWLLYENRVSILGASADPGSLHSAALDSRNYCATPCGSASWAVADEAIRSVPIIVSPFDPNASTNWFGCEFATTLAGTIPSYAGFSLQGVSINIERSVLSRVPNGTVILDAYAEVQFDGLLATTIREYWNTDTATGDGTMKMWNNGTLVHDIDFVSGAMVVNRRDPVVAADEGPVAFVAWGRRRDSTEVYLPLDDIHHPVPRSRFAAIGQVSPGGTAKNGKKSIINMAGAIQAIVDRRDSEFRDFELLPTGYNPNAGPGWLAAAAESYLPDMNLISATETDPATGAWQIEYERVFTRVEFEAMTIGKLLVRFALPDGAVDEAELPIIRGPRVARS